MRIGRYVVTADKAGFSVAVVDNVQVTVGARLRVDVAPAVGQVTEKVEVTASAVQLQTDSSERSRPGHQRRGHACPAAQRPRVLQLALLSPGVRLSALNTGGFTPREVVQRQGLRSTFNNFIDEGRQQRLR